MGIAGYSARVQIRKNGHLKVTPLGAGLFFTSEPVPAIFSKEFPKKVVRYE
jgi:hypothetical protein